MDTIFSLATIMGRSGVAVIRISGPNTMHALESLQIPAPFIARHAKLTKIYHPINKEMIDESLVLWFPAPASFTGEDVAEIHTHGSRAVITALLDGLSMIKSLRPAEAGEFAKRSFQNSKMDLTQAEGLADLIDADTFAQAKQALRQMDGALERLYSSWQLQLIDILAYIEAYIDFPDEDLPPHLVQDITHKISNLKKSLNTHLDDNKRGEKLRDGLYIVIIGAPNSGKSSLLNLLARRDVAIVSNIAGTTRDIIEVHLDIAGYPVILADTAGIRESFDVIETEGIKRALDRASSADLKIAIFDATCLPEIDNSTLDIIDENSIVLVNKSDLINDMEYASLTIKGHTPHFISTTTQRGADELLNILQAFAQNSLSTDSAPIITRARHRTSVSDCLVALDNFSLDKPIELAAEDVRISANALGRITGKIDLEEILDEIFSNFCIGK